MSKPELYNSNEIDEILDSISPAEAEKTKNRMLLAVKIKKAMLELGLNKIRFAEAMHKHPSEITKWLSGTHNFTSDTLFDIQSILKIKLINISDKPIEQTTTYKIFVSAPATQVSSDMPCKNKNDIYYSQIIKRARHNQSFVYNS